MEVDSEEGSGTPEEGLEATAVPYTAGGLLGRYSERGTNEEGETTITPLFERLDAVVDFPGEDASFGEHAPVNGLEVSWEGGFFAESAGEYEFQLTAADTGSIAFGNDEILSFEDTGSYTTEKAKISLSEGWHPIRVHYRSGNNTALVVLSVRAPGAFMEAVQSNLLGVPSIPPESEPPLGLDTIQVEEIWAYGANVSMKGTTAVKISAQWTSFDGIERERFRVTWTNTTLRTNRSPHLSPG